MNIQLKLIEKTWKAGFAVITALILTLGGLFISLNSASAHGNPTMSVRMLATDVESPGDGWQETLNTQGGHTVKFYIEIHNTDVGTNAHNVNAQVSLPGGQSTSHNVPVVISAENAANSPSDSVTLNITSPSSGGTLEYVAGSTRLTWDENGDGTLDYNSTPLPDGITSGGITIADQSGCNEFIMRINFLARVIGGEDEPEEEEEEEEQEQEQEQDQEQDQDQDQDQEQDQEVDVNVDVNQENNQTINITTTPPPVVGGKKIPLKQPDTGVGVLGMVGMAGMAPLGLALTRFGKGRIVGKTEEENLSEFAEGIVNNRIGKSKNS